MNKKDVVLRLLELGHNNPSIYVSPLMDEGLNELGNAEIAVTLEELTRLGLIKNVRPIFSKHGGNFEYWISEETQQLWPNKEKLFKKLSKTWPGLFSEFDVFLSYSSPDSQIAAELKQKLEEKGMRCFMAEVEIDIGKKWLDTIHAALIGAKLFVILLTPRSVDKPWVLIEMGAAWALEKPLIPLLQFVDVNKLPGPLKNYQARIIETSRQVDNLALDLAQLIRVEI
jgi:hypothetical protein